jgi:hypothetical protein
LHILILDNGPPYTATASVLYAHELGLVPITTPAYSPESNGLAEGFVHTFKRDYVNVHELRDAESVLAQLGGWFDDYNRQAPHSALGMRSPADYRALVSASSELTPPICLADWGAEHGWVSRFRDLTHEQEKRCCSASLNCRPASIKSQ